MCGIVGYVGFEKAQPILIEGLKLLEYRGYDSSGIATVDADSDKICVAKEKGKIKELVRLLDSGGCSGRVGIGHTRWATHGEPSQRNAHPHLDSEERFAIVHNGIFENFRQLRDELEQEGVEFKSETDTECAVHLISKYYEGDLYSAMEKAVSRLHGSFVILAVTPDEPDKIIAFRRQNPLVLGLGEKQNFIASDVSALLAHTKDVVYVEDDQFAIVKADSVELRNLGEPGKSLEYETIKVEWDIEQAQKGGYPHFMLKEINEQPRVVEETVRKLVDADEQKVIFDTVNPQMAERMRYINKVFIVSCGTAYHAGLTAKYMIEYYAKIPAEVNVASEFRYSDPILSKKDLVIFISQSGETADTLAAMHEAKAKGAMTLAICNVIGSTIARESDAVIYTYAGPEIGVASTKAYLAQLTTLCLLSIFLGRLRGKLAHNAEVKLLEEMRELPTHLEKVISQSSIYFDCAKKLSESKNFIYLGRGFNYANALEGALKLKEISYIHAHGYAGGEMKHGPIALVDNELPIVCIAPDSRTYEKMLSNIQEVRAREGVIVAVATEGDNSIAEYSDYVFYVPKVPELMSPILTIVPLQFLAYEVAVSKGCDVDQPRNLAKSVTVE